MRLYIIFGQRKDNTLPPEALEVMDEYCFDDNSEWLYKKLEDYKKDTDFQELDIIKIDIGEDGYKSIYNRFNKRIEIKAVVE